MARPLRILAPGLSYHVTARGNRRMAIYDDDRDRRAFLDVLARVVELHALVCHAYCLMTNHYHLVVTTPSASLSVAIKQLNGPYAQWWNRRHGHVGHLFQGRFSAQVVQDDDYLRTVCRYVVLNPVRAGIVDEVQDWPWSSYRATAGLEVPPRFLQPAVLWPQLSGDDLAAAVRRYRGFVADQRAVGMKPPADTVLGDASFVALFDDWRRRASQEVPRREREVRPALEGLFAGVVTRAARNAQVAKARHLGYPLTAIARHLSLNRSTISKIVAAVERDVGARS